VLELTGGGKTDAVPRPVVFGLGKLSELPLGALGKPSPIALYRLQSALARLTVGHRQGRAAARVEAARRRARGHPPRTEQR
jgi:hypothetical protein